MARLVVPMLICALSAGCKTTADFGWSVTNAGCFNRGLYEVFEAPESQKLGFTDIQIGRLPDIGQEPGVMVHFQRRFGGLGVTEGPPRVAIAVGDFNRKTCVVVVDESSCPAATGAYQKLLKSSLPLGFMADKPVMISLMHGTPYYLLSRDGRGNVTRWRYYGSPEHPMQTEIDSVLSDLETCIAPASKAYGGEASNNSFKPNPHQGGA